MFYIHKHEIALRYGGPEEGGWYYEEGWPAYTQYTKRTKPPLMNVLGPFEDVDFTYRLVRALNAKEHKRQETEDYDYHSVLSYKSTHYTYSVAETSQIRGYPAERPYYQ